MSFNIHLLLHLPRAVQQTGPLWASSCFPFEGYNGDLRLAFHSSQHPETQVRVPFCPIKQKPNRLGHIVFTAWIVAKLKS